jgi:hypothetical protein
MALTTTISQAELGRVAEAAYEGKAYRVSLGYNNTTGLTANSTVAQWDAVKLSGNGYADSTGTIGAGTYNATTARYELPQIAVTFTASGGNWTYDTLYVVITDGGTDVVHSIVVENPTVTLVDGGSITYRVVLNTDD